LIKILFISHNASRTGAPIMLLHLLKWLKSNTNLTFEVLLQHEGLLNPSFESIAKTYTLFKKNGRLVNKLLNQSDFYRSIYLQTPRVRKLKSFIKKKNFNLVYANTLDIALVLNWLNLKNTHLITHVHELEDTIQNYIGINNFQELKKLLHYLLRHRMR